MDRAFARFAERGIALREAFFTALDRYFGCGTTHLRFAVGSASIIDLAKAADTLDYPGLFYADAAYETPQERLYIRSAEAGTIAERAAFAPLELLFDPERRVYLDPAGIYPELRARVLAPRTAPAEELIFGAAGLLARYDYELPADFVPAAPRDFPLTAQRDLLELVLTGQHPERAFGFLVQTGFVGEYWPELAQLAGVSQSKEYHPEGDAWEHTLETFRYRKRPDLSLSLALLLHDTGKPRAKGSGGRRFDRHAEIGGDVASRFLSRLGFPAPLIADVTFLVRYHMLPAALPRLPLDRGGIEALDDPRFPLLLELYKCDELSTFRGPDGYYASCAAYRAYIRRGSPARRNAEAVRLSRLYLEEGIR